MYVIHKSKLYQSRLEDRSTQLKRSVAQLSFRKNGDLFLPTYFKSLSLLTTRRSGDVESILRAAFVFIPDLDLIKYS